jgi:hypothetical protein
MSKFTDSLIGENLEVATEYFKSVMASSNMDKDSKTGKRKKSGGSIGFIPFNINFKMDGLSGIKIYNELVFNTSFLPPGYSTTLDFIVTGVDHQLKNGDWETDVKVTLVPKTDESSTIITGSISVNSQKESYTPPPVVTGTGTVTVTGGSVVGGNKNMAALLVNAGYTPGTFVYELALIMGTKEGYGHPGNIPTDLNNPGDLLYDSTLKTFDPGVTDPKRSGFAKFSTPEIGAKALIELKIKKWAKGNYPATVVGAKSSATLTAKQQKLWGVKTAGEYRTKFKVPSSLDDIAGKKVNMTLEQFMYIYAPPHENNTENYINSIIKSLLPKYPSITRTSKLIDFIDK